VERMKRFKQLPKHWSLLI